MSDQIRQILSNGCSCEVQMRETQFDCLSPDHDFVLFRGLLFAPVSTTSAALLSLLEDWVSSGPHQLTIVSTNPVSSVCRPGEMYADSPACVEFINTTTTATSPTNSVSSDCRPGEMYTESLGCVATTTTTTMANKLESQGSGEDLPVAVLGGVAVGSFLVGILSCTVLIFIYHLARRQ